MLKTTSEHRKNPSFAGKAYNAFQSFLQFCIYVSHTCKYTHRKNYPQYISMCLETMQITRHTNKGSTSKISVQRSKTIRIFTLADKIRVFSCHFSFFSFSVYLFSYIFFNVFCFLRLSPPISFLVISFYLGLSLSISFLIFFSLFIPSQAKMFLSHGMRLYFYLIFSLLYLFLASYFLYLFLSCYLHVLLYLFISLPFLIFLFPLSLFIFIFSLYLYFFTSYYFLISFISLFLYLFLSSFFLYLYFFTLPIFLFQSSLYFLISYPVSPGWEENTANSEINSCH